MIRTILWLALILVFIGTAIAQSDDSNPPFLIDQGHILYEYSGNTTGTRALYFIDYGKEQALHTQLIRSSTFFAITTSTPENVAEYRNEGRYYHFDLDSQKGLVLDIPFHLLHKYFRIPLDKDYRDGLSSIGAEYIGNEVFKDFDCEKWTYRGRKIWVWKGFLLKMISTGLNKNFTMEAVEIDFESPVPDKFFVFPENIGIRQ